MAGNRYANQDRDTVALQTELLYFLVHKDGCWAIQCEQAIYGPFASFPDAYAAAITEAHEAGQVGFDSKVLVPVGNTAGLYQIEWTYGEDTYFPTMVGRA